MKIDLLFLFHLRNTILSILFKTSPTKEIRVENSQKHRQKLLIFFNIISFYGNNRNVYILQPRFVHFLLSLILAFLKIFSIINNFEMWIFHFIIVIIVIVFIVFIIFIDITIYIDINILILFGRYHFVIFTFEYFVIFAFGYFLIVTFEYFLILTFGPFIMLTFGPFIILTFDNFVMLIFAYFLMLTFKQLQILP